MQKINGLLAATFTPFYKDGSLNLSVIPAYAKKLKEDNVTGAFICGTTGEGMFLSLEERKLLTETWIKEQTDDFNIIVHVGTTSVLQSNDLAKHAQQTGASAISAMGPVFLPPSKTSDLVDFCASVANGAPDLPFYYYHIPTISHVNLPMTEFLQASKQKIPNLAGIKFTHRSMMEMIQCLRMDDGKWDILHGFDEELLMGLAAGAEGAVGSTYNYLAPLYNKIIKAFRAGNLQEARELQYKSINFVEILIKYGGGVAGGKPIMKFMGIDCGPLRTPAHNISEDETANYLNELRKLDFFGLD
ncbi:dihydrodipicolinate synthase family protein [Kriegella aquimaris]|uniref:N-acetylneuraminate lyase n=1 Tax=Kriegella aquimaris TaxID=192904 RepID=A0A1G9VDR1_9FLAO|nr:dihydrodipicolinate synthase family protein [Kriegella aquimaris]SDM70005.1 N-acetylneuraminate lyase [Kriegella aquimaris]